jgi:hypothetical protein
MGVLQSGSESDFSLEPVWPEGRRQFRMKYLERDLSVMLQVVGEVNRGHAAPAELALD